MSYTKQCKKENIQNNIQHQEPAANLFGPLIIALDICIYKVMFAYKLWHRYWSFKLVFYNI